MQKFFIALVATLILTGCVYDSKKNYNGNMHGKMHGTNMKDGDPERSISRHGQNVAANEAAAASAASAAVRK